MTFFGWSMAVAAVVWWVSAIWYTVRARWWRHQYGINFFSSGLAVAVALTLPVLRRLIGPFEHEELFWLIIFGFFIGLGVWRTVLIERMQRRYDEKREDEESVVG